MKIINVDQILAAKAKEKRKRRDAKFCVSTPLRRIDETVYAFYVLTEEEIKVVEVKR